MGLITSRDSKGKIVNGVLFDTPSDCVVYCKGNKCSLFYQKNFESNTNGFLVCPFGHAVYFDAKHKIAYTGLKIKGFGSKKKNGGSAIFLPTMTSERIEALIAIERSIKVNECECAAVKELKCEMLHGMEKILSTCRAKSESLLSTIEDETGRIDIALIRENLKTILIGNIELRNIFYTTRFRFDETLSAKRFQMAVYSKFYKAMKLLRRYRGRNVRIRFEGESFSRYNLTSAFEMLPYLLLENAVKFSLEGGEVLTTFSTERKSLRIQIENIGPYTSKTKEELFSYSERGEHSLEAGVEGSGVGLFTCKRIADLNNLGLDVCSDKSRLQIVNGIPYAPFSVMISIPDALYEDDGLPSSNDHSAIAKP